MPVKISARAIQSDFMAPLIAPAIVKIGILLILAVFGSAASGFGPGPERLARMAGVAAWRRYLW